MKQSLKLSPWESCYQFFDVASWNHSHRFSLISEYISRDNDTLCDNTLSYRGNHVPHTFEIPIKTCYATEVPPHTSPKWNSLASFLCVIPGSLKDARWPHISAVMRDRCASFSAIFHAQYPAGCITCTHSMTITRFARLTCRLLAKSLLALVHFH